MADRIKNYGIILASGGGVRFGQDLPKQFVKIGSKTVLEHTIEIFEASPNIDQIIVVVSKEHYDYAQKIISNNNYEKLYKLVNGGITRQESSSNGVNSIEDEEANVIIHDCARPLLTQELLNSCIKALDKYDAVALGIPSTDTLWEIDESGFIKDIPDRMHYRLAQTPQCFKLSIIKKAHALSVADKNSTDDCTLVLKNNLGKIRVIEGGVNNIKITYQKDMYLAEYLLSNDE